MDGEDLCLFKKRQKRPNFSVNMSFMWYRDLRLSDDPLNEESHSSIHQASKDWAPQIWPEDNDLFGYQYPRVNSNLIAAVSYGYANSIDEAKKLIDDEMIKSGIKVIDDRLMVMI